MSQHIQFAFYSRSLSKVINTKIKQSEANQSLKISIDVNAHKEVKEGSVP